MPGQARLNPAQKVLLAAIKWYQTHLSPDHSPRKVFYPYGYCRYTPTCSQYSVDAIRKHGAIWGSVLTLWRILRCNPWSHGGHDPVR
ncbi:MAG: membrane protein insertion efficiency factor YidD [bacterium]